MGLINGQDDDDYEAKLFRKSNSLCGEWPILKRNDGDEGSFSRQDVVQKLSPPMIINKTARREEFVFMYNRNRWKVS